MKKRLIQLALILGLMTLTCVAAQATESEPATGLRNVQVLDAYKNDVVLTPMDASGRTVSASASDAKAFPGASKIGVTYKNPQSGSEYLLIVLSGDETPDDDTPPTVDNVAFIDQQPAGSTAIDFTAFPKKVDEKTASVKYSVYLSSNTDASAGNGVTNYTKVGTFEYYNNAIPDPLNFTPGDVNNDGEITVPDAVLTLQYFVGAAEPTETQQKAADVNGDGAITVPDAVLILQYFVGAITAFPASPAS